MSCLMNPMGSPFHESIGMVSSHVDPTHHHHLHNCASFPQENFLLGKSPKLISASWETLEMLPRMSPPTSESITTHLLSSNSTSSPPSYFDSVLYKFICTPEFLKSAKENYILPMLDTEFNQIVLPVECGKNCAFMYLTRLCQGSKGPCILFNACYWLTPNEFQSISGRNSAKDWKRSIRHNGKSIKLLINKGILTVHSPLCDCAYGSSVEPFVEKYSTTSPTSPIYSTVSLDTKVYSGNDSESGRSDILGGSEDDPEGEEKISSCNSDSENRMMEEGNVGNEEVSNAAEMLRDIKYHFAPLLGSAASESQGEESSSITVKSSNGGDTSTTTTSTVSTHKSKRKPSAKQVHQHKPSAEQQSPTHLSSTTSSPPMTPPPPQTQSGAQGTGNSNNNSSSGGSSSPPQQPIKQMEQMMTSSTRNYSDFMRTLAAKYNHQQFNHNNDYFPNLSFDTRFLKPAAAAAFLNLSQLPSPILLDKEKFPMIDMSSTQTLLSMVRSASAAAAAAAATSNNNNNNINNNNEFKTSLKRPNSPLDLSSRDLPVKKSKLKSPLDLIMAKQVANQTGNQGAGNGSVCMSSCSSGCSEEAQAMINWSIDEVCQFVGTIDLCKDYVEVFREHSIDGTALPLLSEEHLMTAMNMKLGPALKFRSTVAKRLGNCAICSHCTHCHNHNNN